VRPDPRPATRVGLFAGFGVQCQWIFDPTTAKTIRLWSNNHTSIPHGPVFVCQIDPLLLARRDRTLDAGKSGGKRRRVTTMGAAFAGHLLCPVCWDGTHATQPTRLTECGLVWRARKSRARWRANNVAYSQQNGPSANGVDWGRLAHGIQLPWRRAARACRDED